MEPQQLLDPAAELPDRGNGFRHSGNPDRRNRSLVYYPVRSEMQEIHLRRVRLSLHDARLDAGPVLDQYVSEQQGGRRRDGYGGIPFRHLHAGMVCVRPLSHDHGDRAPLFTVCLSADRRYSEEYGRYPGGERYHSEGQQVHHYPPGHDSHRDACHSQHLPADFLFGLCQLHCARFSGIRHKNLYPVHQDAGADPGRI